MGASVGAAAVKSNIATSVLWASKGRSDATRERAERGELTDCGDLETLVRESDIILSVCPPHNAEEVGNEVAALDFNGLYLEGNAIAPDRTRRIEKVVTAKGASFVDGGIIGGPAWEVGDSTMLHLSGIDADAIADLFEGSPLNTNIISDQVGAASALKMAYAAYTKGSTALLTAILGVAEKEGVRASLEEQWGDDFTNQTHRRVAANTAKAWRFVGEMEEIAATFAGAGLSDGFHLAAAETFKRLADFKDSETPGIEDVLQKLLK
jgi:3-hydroxyisobutyrate dehydrogenase-like beta-hydroxyacid dehydrogenase